MGGEGGVFGPPRISDPRTAYHTQLDRLCVVRVVRSPKTLGTAIDAAHHSSRCKCSKLWGFVGRTRQAFLMKFRILIFLWTRRNLWHSVFALFKNDLCAFYKAFCKPCPWLEPPMNVDRFLVRCHGCKCTKEIVALGAGWGFRCGACECIKSTYGVILAATFNRR